jgi:hypothetical protein
MAMSLAETTVATDTRLSGEAAGIYRLIDARLIALAAHYKEDQAG